MATLTPGQRATADAMLAQTMANPAMQTQGWTDAEAPKGYLQLGRGGAVNDPGNWLGPSPAGGAPVRQVQSQPVTLPRQTKLTTASFPIDALYRSPAELSAFAGAPKAAAPAGWTQAGRNQFGIAMQPTTGVQRYAVDANGVRTDPYSYGAQPPVNPAVQAATQVGQNIAPPFPASVDERLNARAKAGNPGYVPPVQVADGIPQTLDELAAYNSGQAATMPNPGGNPDWGNLSRNLFGAAMDGTRLSPPVMRPAGPTGQAAGRQYVNGKQVGYAPITIGNGVAAQTFLPTNGGTAYGLANAAGQIRALDRQAVANGQTGTTVYRNGQRVGNVGGGTAAQAYDNAATRSRSGPSGGNGVASSTNPWGY